MSGIFMADWGEGGRRKERWHTYLRESRSIFVETSCKPSLLVFMENVGRG